MLHAVILATGGAKWKYSAIGPTWSSPSVAADGTVYVGSDNSKLPSFNSLPESEKHLNLHAVITATGEARWKYDNGGAGAWVKSKSVQLYNCCSECSR